MEGLTNSREGRVPPLTPGARVTLTGATGQLGPAIAAELARLGVRRVVRVARSKPKARAAERVHAAERSAGMREAPEGWRVVEGDVTEPGLGMSPDDLRVAFGACDLVIHAAADTSLGAGLGCDAVNRVGTSNVIDAIRAHGDASLCSVSTAYVIGADPPRVVTEEAGRPARARHATGYTKSKAEAERLVEASGLPRVIVRPSILVPTGAHARPKWLRGLVRSVAALESAPVDPDALVDVMLLDDAARDIVALLASDCRRHDVYNVTRGPGRAPTIAQIAALADPVRTRPEPLRLVKPRAWDAAGFEASATPVEAHAMEKLRALLPFLNLDTVFDRSRIDADAPLAEPISVERLLEAIGRVALASGSG